MALATVLGPDYIDLAFRTAAEADPKALLVYNDYGLDYDTWKDEAKRGAVLKLLERLKSRGTPIHAFGMQAHLRADETRFNAKKLKAFLRNIAELDLKILITELDVTDKKLPKISMSAIALLLECMKIISQLCWMSQQSSQF